MYFLTISIFHGISAVGIPPVINRHPPVIDFY